ncbi:hypothetical protein MMC13_004469 [Lambiella insularis]|nr:hypothetical protein [Lambiella insularis]
MVTIRKHRWLAAGAAASVLTYSGVAAIHSLILFATNSRLHLPQAKTRCESIPTPSSNTQFVACAGINDPDISVVMRIVSSVMLGTLPVAAWSTTFRKSSGKAVLMFWLLLLAVGHTFWPLTIVDQNFHFQICPKDYVEPLPGADFQAPLLDHSWFESFHSLVSASQLASPFFENGSVPACIYSCFATTAYIGRSSQDVMVYPITSSNSNPFVKSGSGERLAIILFWWAYVCLALLTLFTTEEQSRLPTWVHKRLFSVEYHQQSWISIWKCKIKNKHATNIVQITSLQLIQLVTQLCSIAAFGGAVLYTEIRYMGAQWVLEQEQFAAVGQWSCVAVIILVLFAAVINRIWAADERGGVVGSVTAQKSRSSGRGDKRRDEEWMGREEWDWRVGYAS